MSIARALRPDREPGSGTRRRPLTLVASLLVAAAALLAPATPAKAATTCTAFGSITQGKYWLNNNLWGQGSGSGWQCIWDSYTSGDTTGWGTNWSWTGQQNSVKSYSSSVLGWHWGWQNANTGLSVQLSANRTVNTGWNFSVNAGGTFNVAYDLWAHTIPNPTWENNPTDEIMIWLYRAGGAGPLGTLQGSVNIGGATWDLYRGNIGWNVFSFVRQSNTTNSTLNLRDFLNDLVSRGWMSNSKYLTSVQAGTEVFHGSGRLDTNSYYANVS